VSISYTGHRVAITSLGFPTTTEIWDTQSAHRIRTIRITAVQRFGSKGSALHPDGSLLLTWSDTGTTVWDVESGFPAGPRLGYGREVRGGLFAAVGRAIYLATKTEIECWDWLTGERIWSIPHKDGGEFSVSPDGLELLVARGLADKDGVATLFNTQAGRQISPPFHHPDMAFSVAGADNHTSFIFTAAAMPSANPTTAFSADGRRVVTVSQSSVRVWERVPPPKVTKSIPSYIHPARGGHLSPDFSRILDYSQFGGANTPVNEIDLLDLTAVALMDANLPKPRARYSVKGFADHAVFSPDARQVMVTSSEPRSLNGVVQVWDRATGQAAYPPFTHPNGLRFAAYSPSGRRIVGVARSGWRVWDAVTGAAIGPGGRWEGGRLRFAAFRPDDLAVLLLDELFNARLYDASSGQPLGREFQLPWAGYAVFSPDGKRVLAPAGGDTGQIVDPVTGERAGPTIPRLFSPGGGGIAPPSPVFRADGALVLALDREGVRVFEVATGQPVTPLLPAMGMEIVGFGFSPDGKQVGVIETRFTPDERLELVGREWVIASDHTLTTATLAARLASGRESDSSGSLVVVPAERQQADWAQLQAKGTRPGWSSAEIQDWHLGLLTKAAYRGLPDWRAMSFHLGMLLSVDSENMALRQRLETAIRERDSRPRQIAPSPRLVHP
jgi:hypothetical protein